MPAIVEQIKRVKAKRNKLVADSRALVEKAEKENREVSSEENTTLESLSKDIDSLAERINTLEGLNKDDDDGDGEGRDDDKDADADKSNTAADDEGRSRPKTIILADGRRATVIDPKAEKRGNTGRPGLGKLTKRMGESDSDFRSRERRSSEEYEKLAREWVMGQRSMNSLRRESRTVQADLDIIGGYLVMPEKFVNQVLKAADNYLFVRQKATVFKVNESQSLGVPSLDADPDDADWTSELATGNLDNATRFGKRELKPSPMAKRLKISNKLMRLSSVSGVLSVNDESTDGQGSGFERFLTGRLGYKIGVTQEKGFMTGNGVGQPLGLFTASTRGISTARDVTSGVVAAIDFDTMIEMRYSLKQPYQEKAEWLFSRSALRRIRQLKDSMGRYLWQESVQAGEPDKILDRPVNMSEYVPSVFTTGSYVGLFGCFEFYWIADALGVQMQRLDELYAEQNLTGYIARMETDGMPALEEAFSRLKLG